MNDSKLTLDFRTISIALVIIIVAMLALWRPWMPSDANAKTIQITGDAKLSAKPDQFSFSPSYEFTNSDRTAALADLTAKSDEITTKLKDLGINSDKIKTNSSGYDYPVYYPVKGNGNATYTLQFTITTESLDIAQKVEDYLVTTNPTAAVSPQASFSDAKQKELENQARDAATKDARTKADQLANNLGFKIGSVKSVSDSQGFGIPIYPLSGGVAAPMAADTKSLEVQPGENDLNYSVTVVYFIK
jgi:uncharacterized protein YggE